MNLVDLNAILERLRLGPIFRRAQERVKMERIRLTGWLLTR